MKIQDLVDRIMKGASKDLVAVLDDQGILKASQSLSDSEKVLDHWEEGQVREAATREQIKVGPETAATGEKTAFMNKTYSNNAPQHGVALDAEKLARNLDVLGAASKSQQVALVALTDLCKGMQTALSAILVKAEDEEEKKEEKEKDEVVEKSAAKAASLIASAQTLISKANALLKAVDEMDEDDDKDEMKACKKKARLARKSAALILGKARLHAYAAGSDELKKSILTIAAKADVEVLESDEDENEGETEKAKAATLAETAKGDDKGNQDDKADPKSGNQAATAAKSDGETRLAEALAGIRALDTTVKGLFDVISGKSRIGAEITGPTVKAAVNNIAGVMAKIESLEDEGLLDAGQAVIARNIGNQLEAVKGGRMDASVVKAQIAKAPAAVRALYADLAAAA